jgi:hypothetical protein
MVQKVQRKHVTRRKPVVQPIVQSHQAHPVTPHTAARKPIIIAVVAFVVLIGLVSLLFFTDTFVGKAIEFDAADVNAAGIFGVAGDELINTGFVVPIKANIQGEKSIAVHFVLDYDADHLTVDCDGIYDELDAKFIIGDTDLTLQRTSTCADGTIEFDYVGLCEDADCTNAITDEGTIVEVTFTADEAAQYTLDFTDFDMLTLDGTKVVDEGTDGVFTIIECRADADCGDGETCNENNACAVANDDEDGDGVADADDNCPSDANADGQNDDTDSDGEGDACDDDPCDAHSALDDAGACTCDAGWLDDDEDFTNGCEVEEAFECTEVDPADATLCDGDDEDLAADTAKTLVAACTDDVLCEYECNVDFTYDVDTDTCVADEVVFSCTGDDPDANAELCENDDEDLAADTAKDLVAACTDLLLCEYVCSDGFDYDADTDTCLEDNEVSCTGEDPENALFCVDDDADLDADTAKTLVAACTDDVLCEYECNDGFLLEDGICVEDAEVQANECTADSLASCTTQNLCTTAELFWFDNGNDVDTDDCLTECAVTFYDINNECIANVAMADVAQDDADDETFSTAITAKKDLSEIEVSVYTILRDVDNKTLVIKYEVIAADVLSAGETYTATVNYPNPAAVTSKTVLVFDKLPDQGQTVNGDLEQTYE